MNDRVLARIRRCDFIIEDHGLPYLDVDFDMDGSGIGLGYMVDTAFLMRFLEAVGVTSLRDCVGKSCWLTLKGKGWGAGPVIKIEPLHKKDGTPFDIVKWGEWVQAQPEAYRKSAHELRTGEKP